jgi:hypothetical protein
MSKSITLRSIRLLPASYGINDLSYEKGEVFFDTNSSTLRVMDGLRKGGFPIATEEFVNTELTAVENDLQGQINNAIDAIPEVDLTPYYTKVQTDVLLQNVSVDLTGYATETYVGNQIAAIPTVSFDGYATEIFVNTAVTGLVDSAPETLDTLNELAAALGDDPDFATTVSTQIGLKANTADLGTAAFTASTDYATSFQGALADTALQPLDNVSELVNNAGYLISSDLLGLASETYVNSAITSLIDGAPESLDTLNELAAALNDNANLGSEVLASIALKANIADLSVVATSNNYNDLDNIQPWEYYNEKHKGRFNTAAAVTIRQPLVLNLDNTVTPIVQEQSYVLDTFAAYTDITDAPSMPNNRNFSPASDSYGTLYNGPQSHQYARLGDEIFTVTTWQNDLILSAFNENSGTLTELRTDVFNNITVQNSGGKVTASLIADTVNDQLVIISIGNTTSDGMRFRYVSWNGTDNLFASSITGNVSITADGQLLGNSDCQKINAHYNEEHNKIYVAFDYGFKSYFASYTISGSGLVADSYIDSSTSILGAAVLFQPYEMLTYMPTVDNYLLTWGYNTTSMVSVVLDSNGDPSWGTEVALENDTMDVMVNTRINRLGVVASSPVSQVPRFFMYTFYADGTFSSREPEVQIDDGTLVGYNNTARGHFDPKTRSYLIISFFNNGSNNKQRPAYSSDGSTWTYGSDINAGSDRVVDGHYSGDDAVYQIFVQGNNFGNPLRHTTWTNQTGPIISNLSDDNLIGVSSGSYPKGTIGARIYAFGDIVEGFSNLVPGDTYYATTAGIISNTPSSGAQPLGIAIDETQINVTLDHNGGAGASVSVSDTPPSTAGAGDLWWESDTGRLKVYYEDADTQQWVDASPPISVPNTPYIVGAVKGGTSFGSGFSVVENSTGNYTVTFNTALPNANYSIITTAEDVLARFVFVQNRTTTSFDLLVQTEAGGNSGARANFAVYNIG